MVLDLRFEFMMTIADESLAGGWDGVFGHMHIFTRQKEGIPVPILSLVLEKPQVIASIYQEMTHVRVKRVTLSIETNNLYGDLTSTIVDQIRRVDSIRRLSITSC